MSKLFLATIVIILLNLSGLCAQVTGIIKNQKGEPLANVYVIYDESMNTIINTKSDGQFSFITASKVIFFRAEGYEPQTKIIDGWRIALEIILQQVDSKQINLPNCASIKVKGKRIGRTIKFLAPNNAKLRLSSDIDYSSFHLSRSSGKERFQLSGIWGLNASLGVPRQEQILNSVEFTEHYLPGFTDSKGKLKDGTYWRYIGQFGEAYYYTGVNAQAAEYFDSILDTACK